MSLFLKVTVETSLGFPLPSLWQRRLRSAGASAAARGLNAGSAGRDGQGLLAGHRSWVKILHMETKLPIAVGAGIGLWGKILEEFQQHGLKQWERMAEFHQQLQCLWLVLSFQSAGGLRKTKAA